MSSSLLSEAVLSQDEKDLGVALIDIGGGTTDIAIWSEGSIIHTSVLPWVVTTLQVTSQLAYVRRWMMQKKSSRNTVVPVPIW